VALIPHPEDPFEPGFATMIPPEPRFQFHLIARLIFDFAVRKLSLSSSILLIFWNCVMKNDCILEINLPFN
jgi:hypothetical protein